MAQQFFDDEVAGKAFDARLARKSVVFVLPHKLRLFWALLAILTVSAVNLLLPKIVGRVVNEVGIKNIQALMAIGISLIGLYFLRWMADYALTLNLSMLGQNVIYDIRHTLFNHLQNLSLSFFDNREVGRIIARLTSDVSALNELITSGSLVLIADALTVVGAIVIMYRMNSTLSLRLFTLFPIILVGATIFRGQARLAFREVRRKQATVTATVAENVTGVRVVKSFSREGENLRRFERVNKENQQAAVKARVVGAAFFVMIEVLAGGLGMCIVYFYGGPLVKSGALKPGDLVTFALYVDRFLIVPIRNTSQFYYSMQSAMAGAERIFEIMDTEPTVKDKPDAITMPMIKGAVEFQNVNFAYGETPILKNVNFKAKHGDTIALVGPTGAGKTTIINLLGRQYDVTSGSVKVDGIDVRDVTLNSLRTQMGIVLQDSFLFPGTVKDNIRYGRLDATDEDIIVAAKMVGAHDFILRMPDGYESRIQEGGSNLSSGQKQLVSFARALLANPRILILDEATSSVDAHTELLIQDALRILLEGRTSFVIAHRLSTISEADCIMVIEAGRIAESGTHEELLNKNGLYRKLYDAQFKYENISEALEAES